MKLEDIPGTHTIQTEIAAQGTAGTADEWAAFRAPFNLTVTAVYFVPNAAATGNDTNNFIFDLRNRGTDASGTTDIATLTFATGVDLVAFVPKALTVTAANAEVAAGEVVTLERRVTASGLASPDGTLVVEYQSGT